MAVSTTHSVTVTDVLEAIPVKSSRVGATTDPVSTGMIEKWIESAAGQLNAMLQRHGIDPTSLGDDETELIQSGIIAFAAAMALVKFGGAQDLRSVHFDTWKDVKKTIREQPQDLGNSQKATAVIKSNIDTANPTRKDWDSDNFGGW